MYLAISSKPRRGKRNKTARLRAGLKAKNRKRVNRMARRRASAKGVPSRH
jgi:hypothetical protein